MEDRSWHRGKKFLPCFHFIVCLHDDCGKPSKRIIVQFNLEIVNYTINRRNRRATIHRSHLSLIPLEKLFPGRNDILVYKHPNSNLPDASSLPQRRPGPNDPHWKIPVAAWPIVLHRIDKGEPLRKVASDYGVSYETVRRVIRAARAEMKSSR
jgi:hypothetical protein